jgi:hypothetical protein
MVRHRMRLDGAHAYGRGQGDDSRGRRAVGPPLRTRGDAPGYADVIPLVHGLGRG